MTLRRLLLPVLIIVTISLSLSLLTVPLPARAFDPFGRQNAKDGTPAAVDCSGSKEQQSTVCSTPNYDPLTGSKGLFVKITHIVAFFAGAAAVIMIIVGSIRYITSGSDISTGSRTDTDVEDAKRTISSALIGLVIIVMAQAIITFVVRRL